MICLAARASISKGDQGGVGLVTRERPVLWGFESMHYHVSNMVSYEIVNGLTLIPLVGAYLPPSMMEHLPDLEEALECFREPILRRDLNVDLDESRSLRSQQVANLLA